MEAAASEVMIHSDISGASLPIALDSTGSQPSYEELSKAEVSSNENTSEYSDSFHMSGNLDSPVSTDIQLSQDSLLSLSEKGPWQINSSDYAVYLPPELTRILYDKQKRRDGFLLQFSCLDQQ
ncbi:hypothetical protein E1189_01395 [Sansalvadorimonas verongulae]|nr:hypothetical protein [Sansalvadorimonas verongulae]